MALPKPATRRHDEEAVAPEVILGPRATRGEASPSENPSRGERLHLGTVVGSAKGWPKVARGSGTFS